MSQNKSPGRISALVRNGNGRRNPSPEAERDREHDSGHVLESKRKRLNSSAESVTENDREGCNVSVESPTSGHLADDPSGTERAVTITELLENRDAGFEACGPQTSEYCALPSPSRINAGKLRRGACAGAAYSGGREIESCSELSSAPSPHLSAGDLLIEAIAEAVVRKVDISRNRQRRLVEIEEAATYLGMSVHALRHKAGIEIPVIQIDKKLRFDLVDLDRHIDRARRKGI